MWLSALNASAFLLAALIGSFCTWNAEAGKRDGCPPLDCSPYLNVSKDALPYARDREDETPYRHWEPVLMRCFSKHSYNRRYYPINPAYSHDSLEMELKYAVHMLELTSFGVRIFASLLLCLLFT